MKRHRTLPFRTGDWKEKASLVSNSYRIQQGKWCVVLGPEHLLGLELPPQEQSVPLHGGQHLFTAALLDQPVSCP